MQYTPNYNLITVEGTDVVNPLVQMNPNFTDIDTAMFANKQAVIGSASEIVSGTVHSITRANPDSNYFRYTATGNWTSGDSMNVDGVTVTVYLTDGTTPGTGSYVINSEVFGMINGSRVTLFLASSPVTSLDADQVTFDPTGTSLDPSDTDVDKALRDIDSLISGLRPGSVEVVADGVKTYGQMLNSLFGQIGNLTSNAKLIIETGTVKDIFSITQLTPTAAVFGDLHIRAAGVYAYSAIISANSLYFNTTTPNNYADATSTVPAYGVKFKLVF